MEDASYTAAMARALGLARRAWGRTHPNPMVGAVILEGGEIVAEGFHARAGEPHAEVAALRALGRAPKKGAVLCVTLEPCSTHGRTPPCTEAILAAGLRKVVVGARDPNPAHAGRGLEILRAAGVEVAEGVLAQECEDLNIVFNHWIQHKTPLVAGKAAATLDGKIAARAGSARRITGDAALADVHRWRAAFPAIAVGSGTALADDPALTVRLAGEPERCARARFVFDRRLRTLDRPQLKIFTDAFRDRTVIVADERAPAEAQERCARLGARLWRLPQADFFGAFRARCAAEGIVGVYCEGGSRLTGALLSARALDYFFLYRAPTILADGGAPAFAGGDAPVALERAVRLRGVRRAVFGGDDLIRGHIEYPQ